VDVGPRLLRVGEEPGGLDDDVDAEVVPRELRGVTLGEGADERAVDLDAALDDLHLAVVATEDRVVLEQVRLGGVVTEVVEGDDLDVGSGRLDGTEEVTTDAAEAVDANTNSHGGASRE